MGSLDPLSAMMSIWRATALFILSIVCSCAFATPINTVVFFGDSLSDNGNFYKHEFHFLPKAPYYKGRFSNGPVWSEILGNDLENSYHARVYNYAEGGAIALGHGIISHIHPFLETEIDAYIAETPFPADSQTLYSIWIGGNDYLDITVKNQDDIDRETDKVVRKIMSGINQLSAHGGNYFLIFNLPDFSKTPYSLSKENSDRTHLHNLAITHNRKLADAIQQFKTEHPNVHIAYHDIYSDFNALFNNPEITSQPYNQHIINTTTACFPTHLYGYFMQQYSNIEDKKSDSIDIKEALGTYQLSLFHTDPCSNPDEYLFWDRIHPSAATHKIIAQIAEKALLDENIISIPSPPVENPKPSVYTDDLSRAHSSAG